MQSDQLSPIGADMTSSTSLLLSIYNLLLYGEDQENWKEKSDETMSLIHSIPIKNAQSHLVYTAPIDKGGCVTLFVHPLQKIQNKNWIFQENILLWKYHAKNKKKTKRILENKIFLLCTLAISIILNHVKCHLTDGIHWMLSSIAVPTFEEDMVLRWFLEKKIKFLMGRYKILIFDLNCWLTLEAVQIII